MSRRLAIIGFDSISLGFLETFVKRGVLPTIGRLMEQGCTTQTWPCYPMETGTNWACLATGASPRVTGCNMSVHLPGTPLDARTSGFPGELCLAEQLWTTAHRAGKRSVVFDWSQSWPLKFEDGIVHVGEDGRPDNAFRALQDDMAYTTHPRQPGPHVTRIEPVPAAGWTRAPAGALEFAMPIQPGPASRYKRVEPMVALVLKGAGGAYDRVAVYASKNAAEPLHVCRLGPWTPWKLHAFDADGRPVQAGLRGRLLRLAPDATDIHLYLSEIYAQADFAHPKELAAELAAACGPFVIQCSRQQVVQGGASDIATYFDEQEYLARWWRAAAGHILGRQDWDLFMLKWHGPDWTNHLTMYMIDPRHPMHEPARAEEGWALWDRIMGWGDEIVARVVEAAGPDAVIALVSDHGGDTLLPGPGAGHRDPNAILAEQGWLVRENGRIDWPRTRAFGTEHYVYLNVKGRDPQGIVEPGRDYQALREQIVEALLAAVGPDGRHLYRVVLPMEDAGRLGVGGDRVGDVFMVAAKRHPLAEFDREAFWKTHTREQTGTWDWPRLNAGAHSDDSYFILSGPGVRRGFRRGRPAPITSVAPTCATAFGIPVPAHADGAVLWDFF